MVKFQMLNVVSLEISKENYKGHSDFRIIKVYGKTDDGAPFQIDLFVAPDFMPEVDLEKNVMHVIRGSNLEITSN